MNQLAFKPIVSEAWQKVKGAKKAFFWVFIVLAIVQSFLYVLQLSLNQVLPHSEIVNPLLNLLYFLICTPFLAGCSMLGLRRARGETIRFQEGYAYFKKIFPLFGVQIMTVATMWLVIYCGSFGALGLILLLQGLPKVLFVIVAVILGFLLLLLCITVMTSFGFTYMLVADQNKSPWQAYKGSIKMAFPHLKLLVTLEVIFLLLDIVGTIPVGIGLIWTVPFSYIITGILYREILLLHK